MNAVQFPVSKQFQVENTI